HTPRTTNAILSVPFILSQRRPRRPVRAGSEKRRNHEPERVALEEPQIALHAHLLGIDERQVAPAEGARERLRIEAKIDQRRVAVNQSLAFFTPARDGGFRVLLTANAGERGPRGVLDLDGPGHTPPRLAPGE